MPSILFTFLMSSMTIMSILPIMIDGQTYCPKWHHWWDGRQCHPCTQGPCGIGTYRETCKPSSQQDARCIPCSLPPVHARHVTGGLPYMQDACLWACHEGFFKKDKACFPCTTSKCDFPLVREQCLVGMERDAECVCPINTFAKQGTCVDCKYTSCESPTTQFLIQCKGTETEDVSACVDTAVADAN